MEAEPLDREKLSRIGLYQARGLIRRLIRHERICPDDDLDELESQLARGVLKAVSRYSPTAGLTFYRYVSLWMRTYLGLWRRSRMKASRRYYRTASYWGIHDLTGFVDTRPSPTAQHDPAAFLDEGIFKGLAPRDREVLRQNYVLGHTAKEIGRNLGVSEDRVKQLKERAFRVIRSAAGNHNPMETR